MDAGCVEQAVLGGLDTGNRVSRYAVCSAFLPVASPMSFPQITSLQTNQLP